MSDEEWIEIPVRRPGPRPVTCEKQIIRATVMGTSQIEYFRAMCAVAGRRAHELTNDLLLAAIREAQSDPDMQRIVNGGRRYRSGLRVVPPAAASSGVQQEDRND